MLFKWSVKMLKKYCLSTNLLLRSTIANFGNSLPFLGTVFHYFIFFSKTFRISGFQKFVNRFFLIRRIYANKFNANRESLEYQFLQIGLGKLSEFAIFYEWKFVKILWLWICKIYANGIFESWKLVFIKQISSENQFL